tara:strand:+ start:2262 stop:2606 length:345 start_codon:yes stop_codon:yes gene_type:complete
MGKDIQFEKYFTFLNAIQFILGVLLLLVISRFLLSLNNTIRIFSFEDFGSYFDSGILSDYGFDNRKDNLKFMINIRTDDASDDCKIKGKYRDGKLRSFQIEGEGEKCSILRENN